MNNLKYNCICLAATDYKENDKILTLYAQGKGKVTAKLRGCKSPKSKLKFASLPLCFGEYEFAVSHEKLTVVGCETIELFSSLWNDYDVYCASMVMLEILNRFTYDGQNNDELFICVLKCLKKLKNDFSKVNIVLGYFLFFATRTIGYEPIVDCCIICGDEIDTDNVRFSCKEGGLVCADCGNGISVNGEIVSVMKDISSCGFDEFTEREYDEKSLKNVIFVMNKYIESFTGEKVKSLCQYLDNLLQNS